MEDKSRPAMPNYEAHFHKAIEETKHLEAKIAQLNEEIKNYKAVIIALSAVKATAEAFLKTPIDFDLNNIKEYFNER